MLLTIHDAHLRQVASIDNDKQGTLNYFNDTWTSYLETGAATFDFTVSKKELATDTYSKRAYQFLNEKNFISFEYEGETQLFIVRKVVENEKLIKLNCVNLNLELINEYANPYKALKDMSFEEYCKALDLLNFTMLKIGVNEISDKKLTLEWEGQETKLARLLSLANKFGAEIEFKTFLNSNSSIKAFVVNVYHANDGFHQGVGKRQSKVLRYGRDFNSLTRTVDTTGIYNAILPTGNRSEVTSTKTSVIHNVDGSVTTTKKVRNPDGSVTTTSKRVRNDGFVLGQVVTKTVKNPDGTSSTTTEREMTTVYKKRTGRRKKAEEQPPFKVKHSKTSKTSAYSNDSTFDLSDLPDWKLENENGQVEFYKAGKMLYAPLSMQMFPAAFTSDTMSDQWIRRDATIDAETQEELSDKALDMLRKSCYPAVTYEVDGYLPYGVGDTVEIEDDGFALTLLLEMRVSERSISFTGTGTNKSVFANFKALENQLSSGIQQRLEEMLEEAKPYDIKVASDNGTVFKNNKGKSTIYPTLLKGEKTIPDSEVSWKWKVDERDFPLAPTFTVEAAGLTKPLTVTVIAIVNGKEVAHKELAFTNVNDGAKGSDGKSITVAKAEKQADGVKVTFSDNKSIVVPKGDKGDPADPAPLNALEQEMKQAKQGLSDVKADLLKEKAESSAKIDQVKQDVGAIRNQQTAYEQTNTQNLARITGQLADKASKTEVKQTADGIREEISQLSKNADEKISAAKTTLEKTAEGLKTDMTAVKSYVADDGKRQEALQKYARDESAKQTTAVREYIANGFVGKSSYQEDVKTINRKFEELAIGGNNLLAYSNFNKNGYYQNGLKSDANYIYSNLIKLSGTDYCLQVWELKPISKQNWAGVQFFDDTNKPTANGYSTFWFNGHLKQLLKVPGTAKYIAISLDKRALNQDEIKFKLELGNIPSDWSPAPEDAETKLAEYKQGVDGQLAAVKQEVGSKVSQATFDQRANQITQSVQELSNNTVKKNQLKIDENGLVSSSEKTVNGQVLASMISQNPEWVEIIAKLLRIKADMIVNGAITADKLNVEKLSALASDLGEVSAGLINLQKHLEHVRNEDVWGTIENIICDKGTILSDTGIVSNGFPIRKAKGDVKPTVMPLVWLNSGELYFTNVDSGYDLRQIMLNGVYPFTRTGAGRIHFGKMEDGRDALCVDCGFSELYLKANNYTDWKQSTFNSGVRWKVQGNLVLVDYDVAFNKDGNQAICSVPQEYVAGARMFVVKAWSLNKDKDRTAQLNAGGDLHILGAEKGMNYRGQIIWTY
ncbi:phage tail protein [Streptococcus anginosus]|uniref:phage tail protein n=1 Tax=Streptococcus anginosus TaxID=1328 RepID=UPI0022E4B148|nr:phage tail protein [Streptococcus anginosus]